MAKLHTINSLSPWELAAETIAVKIRWLGLVIGYVIVNTSEVNLDDQMILNAILALGIIYVVLDTAYSFRRQVFLGKYPLLISLMESLFIGLLCFHHQGLESPFRYYYILSLICCAIRHPSHVTYLTCAFHCASYGALYLALPKENKDLVTFLFNLVILGWVTWASDAMARLLKHIGDHLSKLNRDLKENQSQLEARIKERTLQLQEAQALVLHQEKMAAFGLLAAGIAHEVGNPLTSISSLVQILQKRGGDEYTQEKLALVNGQLKRIQNTLRELVNFSRPKNQQWTLVSIYDIVLEALNITKYYHRTKQRCIQTNIAPDLPSVLGKKDLLVQVVLNLVLNAIDATDKDGEISIFVETENSLVVLSVQDNGIGISPENQECLFQPYFTTKRDGTGLGLFVTQKLVQEHGGKIAFWSTPGEGTCFKVHLPVGNSPAPSPNLTIPTKDNDKNAPEMVHSFRNEEVSIGEGI